MLRHSLVLNLVVAAAFAPGLVGCARAPSGYERYVPDAAKAEAALDQVLTAWKNGEPAGPLKSNLEPITIQVADSTRRPGQRLTDYELLGEIAGEGPRTFAVRLRLDNPSQQGEVRYYLVGIDPLWVFRQEDYDALAHWDVCAAAGAPVQMPARAASQVSPLAIGEAHHARP